jgi:hypothetical protein
MFYVMVFTHFLSPIVKLFLAICATRNNALLTTTSFIWHFPGGFVHYRNGGCKLLKNAFKGNNYVVTILWNRLPKSTFWHFPLSTNVLVRFTEDAVIKRDQSEDEFLNTHHANFWIQNNISGHHHFIFRRNHVLIVSAWEESWSIFLWLYRSLLKCFLS